MRQAAQDRARDCFGRGGPHGGHQPAIAVCQPPGGDERGDGLARSREIRAGEPAIGRTRRVARLPEQHADQFLVIQPARQRAYCFQNRFLGIACCGSQVTWQLALGRRGTIYRARSAVSRRGRADVA